MDGSSDGAGPSNINVDSPIDHQKTNLNNLYNVSIENNFESLSESDDEGFERPSARKRKKVRNVDNVTQNINNGQRLPKITQPKFLPPIRVFNTNIKIFCTALSTKLAHFFEIKNANKNMSLLFTTHLDDYKNAIKLLTEMQKTDTETAFFSNTPREVKPLYFMLRKIANTFDVDDVSTALSKLKFQHDATKFIKVSKFASATSSSQIFLVQFTSSSKVQDIVGVTHLLHQKIQWDIFTRREMIQCYRCQRYGHASSNCGMKPRCVKCLESHEYGKCELLKAPNISNTSTITSTTDLAPTTEINLNNSDLPIIGQSSTTSPQPACVNCRQKGHPASWRGCPAYKVLKQRKDDQFQLLQQRRQQEDQQKQYMFQNFQTSGNTFADNIKKNIFPPLKNTPGNIPILEPEIVLEKENLQNNNVFSFIQDECKNVFGSDLSSLVKKIKQFIPLYKTQKTLEDKQISLMSFVMSLVNIP